MIKRPAMVLVMTLVLSGAAAAKINIDSKSVKFLERGNITEFIGDVFITEENMDMTADRAVSNKKEGTVEAAGNVHMNYSSSTWNVEAWCDNIMIITENKKYILTGNVRTIHKTQEGDTIDVTEISADRIIMENAVDRRIIFEDNVRTKRQDITVMSDRAVYSRDDDRIDFTGSPSAESIFEDTAAEYSGDVITVFLDEERIRITGRAHTRIYKEDDIEM
ncbi:MAG: LptA/OstA family protein [Elusimicrobiota bacterium]